MIKLIDLIDLVHVAWKRRKLSNILHAMSDRQLRDLGIERNFIDAAVAADTRSLLDGGRPETARTEGMPRRTLATQGCG